MNTLNYQDIWNKAMTYASYRQMIDELLIEGKTTGADQSQAMIDYTILNAQRMKRIDKTYTPDASLVERLSELGQKVILLTITESWCGDAAQIVPVLSALAEEASIEVRFTLRDENLELIDQHLTNGGRSIPIVIMLDANDFEVLGTWGPRPKDVQDIVLGYKNLPEPKPSYSEFSKQVQLWYAKDKYKSIEREFSETLIQSVTAKH